jgi:hypothetical protein
VVLSDGISTRNVTVIYVTVDQSDITYASGSHEDYYQYYLDEYFRIVDYEFQELALAITLRGFSTQDASYTVYENDQEVMTGSVEEGVFRIAWSKLDELSVSVDIIFTSPGYPDYVCSWEYGLTQEEEVAMWNSLRLIIEAIVLVIVSASSWILAALWYKRQRAPTSKTPILDKVSRT